MMLTKILLTWLLLILIAPEEATRGLLLLSSSISLGKKASSWLLLLLSSSKKRSLICLCGIIGCSAEQSSSSWCLATATKEIRTPGIATELDVASLLC